jgi:hypothetical protein
MVNKKRRDFITQASALLLISPLLGSALMQNDPRHYKKVLFRTSWNHANSGDVADITSIYRLIQKYVYETQVILWPYDIDDSTVDLLKRNFTSLRIVSGTIDDNGNPTTEELKEAINEADMFIYSAGSEIKLNWSGSQNGGIETGSIKTIANEDIPFIINGLGKIPDESSEIGSMIDICNKASIVFINDVITEYALKERNIKLSNGKTLPNTLVAFELKNDTESRIFLSELKLNDAGFIVISINTMDHFPEAIEDLYSKIKIMAKSWLSNTRDDILIIHHDPEKAVKFQKDIQAELEEEDAKRINAIDKKIMPDTEISIIEKARICVGNNETSAYFAIQAKTPVLYILNADIEIKEDDTTGLGLRDYVIKLSENSGESLAEAVLKINSNYLKAILDISKARENAYKKLETSMIEVNKLINKSSKKKKKN